MVSAALIDTNIIIDHFHGIAAADREIHYYDDAAISAVTWMELTSALQAKLIAGRLSQVDFDASTAFINAFSLVSINKSIMQNAAACRARALAARLKLALPDAIIYATGQVTRRLIVTRNSKDFSGPGVRIPYKNTASSSTKMDLFTPAETMRFLVSDIAPPP